MINIKYVFHMISQWVHHVYFSHIMIQYYCFFFFFGGLQNEQYSAKLKKSNERSLALVKAAMDVVVAVGLLQLAPKKVTPRVTGAFGFVSSLISCYQVCILCVWFKF